jgi:hypothetical protein
MAKQIVMDHTGDKRYNFDSDAPQAVAWAEKRFRELTRHGFTAAVRTDHAAVTRVQSFDPTLEETLFSPRLVGG